MPLPADLILRNGRVLTLDADFATADALAIRARRIVAVGTDADVRPCGPEQRVDLATALRAYTVNAARQDFAESWKGRLTVGRAADVCVLAADPHEIPDIPVDLTVFDGSIVYGKA